MSTLESDSLPSLEDVSVPEELSAVAEVQWVPVPC